MKKIVRLTESDITNIVKRTIMELNKSTYDSAARVADEKGFKKLSNKFSEHGKEFGFVSPNTILNLVFNTGPSEEEHILTEFKLIDIQREGNLENSFITGVIIRISPIFPYFLIIKQVFFIFLPHSLVFPS